MRTEQSKELPAWEDFAAFDDMGTLMSVCYMFEEAAEEGAGIAHFAGEGSYLIKRLEAQVIHSRYLLENERPGLYEKTWMAKLINGLFVRLDDLVRMPQSLPDDLNGLMLDFHKVMIAAHEIYDPRSRAKLVAEMAANTKMAITRSISERNRNAVNTRHAAPGGSHDLRLEAWKLFNSGVFGIKKDDAATPISEKLGVAYSTARKYLRGKPPNQVAA